MANFPGFEFAQHVINTWSSAIATQVNIANAAWGSLESGKYEFKDLLADWSKSYRAHFQACRDVGTFEVRSVPWRHVLLRKEQVETVSFEAPGRMRANSVKVSIPEPLGRSSKGIVEARVARDGSDGLVDVEVVAKIDGAGGEVAKGDQWIAFVYESGVSGPPLGVVLVLIDA